MEEQYSTTGKIRLRNTKKFNFLYWQNPKIKYITMSMSEKAPEHKIKAENPKKIKLLSCKGRIILSHGQIRSRNTKKKSIFCTDKTQKSKEKSNTSQWALGLHGSLRPENSAPSLVDGGDFEYLLHDSTLKTFAESPLFSTNNIATVKNMSPPTPHREWMMSKTNVKYNKPATKHGISWKSKCWREVWWNNWAK